MRESKASYRVNYLFSKKICIAQLLREINLIQSIEFGDKQEIAQFSSWGKCFYVSLHCYDAISESHSMVVTHKEA